MLLLCPVVLGSVCSALALWGPLGAAEQKLVSCSGDGGAAPRLHARAQGSICQQILED